MNILKSIGIGFLGLLHLGAVHSVPPAPLLAGTPQASDHILTGKEATYPAGTYTYTLNNISDEADCVEASFSRDAWPDGFVSDIVITGQAESKYFAASGGLAGGAAIGKNGQIATQSGFGWCWPGEAQKDAHGNYTMDSGGKRVRREIQITDLTVTLYVRQPFTSTILIDVSTNPSSQLVP